MKYLLTNNFECSHVGALKEQVKKNKDNIYRMQRQLSENDDKFDRINIGLKTNQIDNKANTGAIEAL